MARKNRTEKDVEDYRHQDTRPNNPPAGMMADYDAGPPDTPQTRYSYDPHLDPQLMFDPQTVRDEAEALIADILATDDIEEAKAKARQLQKMQEPWLQWTGKAEHTSFDVDNVPLYVHERLSTQAIIRAARREEAQKTLFGDPEMPLDKAVEFYQHPMDWTNRLILGDSLVVMNSLLEREQMAGKVQMIYIDPPYGIGYNSNFQPRVDGRSVRDGKDEDLTREPEQIRAYRDTWTLGIHSYLAYLRDRLVVAKGLLSDTGSVFVQIGSENIHHVREILDDVFGAGNCCGQVFFLKTTGKGGRFLDPSGDYILWYGKDADVTKVRPLYRHRETSTIDEQYTMVENNDGESRRLTSAEITGGLAMAGARRFMPSSMYSDSGGQTTTYEWDFNGQTYRCLPGYFWRTNMVGMSRVQAAGRIVPVGRYLRYKMYADDYPVVRLTNYWDDVRAGGFGDPKVYVVQTASRVIERCILLTTDPGDLVLDPTCGSGTTAYVAEQWGRRWITCDTSRVAVFLARQRLLTAKYDYYALADQNKGLPGGFDYATVPHVTLKSIANNPDLDPDKVDARRQTIRERNPGASDQEIERLLREANEEIIRANADQEVLYDQPKVDNSKVRVSGPFTVEAIPPPGLDAVETPIGGEPEMDDQGFETRQPEPVTAHVDSLIAEMCKDGVLFPDNKKMEFESLTGYVGQVVHAEGSPKNGDGNGLKRVAVSFGPMYGSIGVQQVTDGIREAGLAGFDAIIFCGFSFDAEAHGVISGPRPRNLQVFMAHIRPDMVMTDDRGESLLKTTASSQLFTVFGEPDIDLRSTPEGYVIELLGVDIYNPVDGSVTSDSGSKVAAWFIDTDYDGRTFCVCQAFFPDKSAWQKLGRALKGVIDEDKFGALSGTVSLPFEAGEQKKAAVKVIDHRGNEVMVVVPL